MTTTTLYGDVRAFEVQLAHFKTARLAALDALRALPAAESADADGAIAALVQATATSVEAGDALAAVWAQVQGIRLQDAQALVEGLVFTEEEEAD